jgi:curli biogenesis system outer membrane secretion channel CsgG
MKKLITTIAIIAGSYFSLSAQEKTGVGIIPFSNLGNASNGDVVAIQEAVSNAFVKTKRFNIVDRTKMDALKKEKELQKTEDFMDGAVIQQGVSLGAQFLISGKVTSVTKTSEYKERTKLDGTKVNELVNIAKINFSCQVIDVTTGQVMNSETFSTNGGGSFLGLSLAKDKEEAFASSLSSLESAIDDWVGVNFPATFQIAEIQEKDGKGNATKILIAGGSAFGLEKGERLKVVEITTMEVNGKKIERKKEIGELKITKVEDENFSLCTVKEGGVEINSKFEAKSKLLVMTKK